MIVKASGIERTTCEGNMMAAAMSLQYIHFPVTSTVVESVCMRCGKTIAFAPTEAGVRIAERAHSQSCEVS
jgi:hypothetical protein